MEGKKPLPKKWKKNRVFIGGNYDYLADLRLIESYIPKEFETAVAIDYEVSKDKIHDTDIKLLSKCGYAVFECTTAAGQYMELERARTCEECFVVYQVRARGDPPPSQVSSMITTFGAPLYGYANYADLKAYLRGIFPGIIKDPPKAYLHIAEKSFPHDHNWKKALAELKKDLKGKNK